MVIRRIVPDFISADLAASLTFYQEVLGLQVGMDLGWVTTFVSPTNPTAQLTVMTADPSAPVVPAVTIEVDDVDTVYEAVRAAGYEIVHPLTDEVWGVRRFFVRDPDGVVINLMSHRASSA